VNALPHWSLIALGTVLVTAPGVAGAASPPGSAVSPPRSPVTDRVLVVSDRDVVATIRETSGTQTQDLALDTDVLFAFGSSTLTPAASQTLSRAASLLTSRAKGTVTVTGFTDSVGSDVANLQLSRDRAAAVQRALLPLLARTGPTLRSSGRGEADPIAPNAFPNGKDNPEGRKLNRRVSLAYRS